MTYKGYILDAHSGVVSVLDPRWPESPVYLAKSLAEAKRWVTAYRDGVYWASVARLARPSAGAA